MTITIFKPADITLNVIDGLPPADQSAEVAQLKVNLATATAEATAAKGAVAVLQARLDALNAGIDALQGQA